MKFDFGLVATKAGKTDFSENGESLHSDCQCRNGWFIRLMVGEKIIEIGQLVSLKRAASTNLAAYLVLLC